MKCTWKLHRIVCVREATHVITVKVGSRNIARFDICHPHHADTWHMAQALAATSGGSLHTRDLREPRSRTDTDAVHPYVRISRKLADDMTEVRQQHRESGSMFISRAITERIERLKARKRGKEDVGNTGHDGS